MVSDTNPFQPPASDGGIIAKSKGKIWLQTTMKVLWPIVFGINMIVPLVAGWDLIDEHGYVGAGLSSLLLLLMGWGLFYSWPEVATRMSVGAILTALLQLVPILHLIIGIIAFGITVNLGQATDMSDHSGPEIRTELGGFIITTLMGVMLLLLSLGFGILVFFVINWRNPLVGNRSMALEQND